jgi:hypothetical protein
MSVFHSPRLKLISSRGNGPTLLARADEVIE